MMRTKGNLALALALALSVAASVAPPPPAAAKERHHPAKAEPHKARAKSAAGNAKSSADKPEAASPEATAPAAEAAPPEPPPPYEPQVLRLAEILGALAFLDALCGYDESVDWRARMQAFMETEANTPRRKERLAGLFNRSFRGYERSYQICTANAQAAITRFLREGGEIARELADRYGAS